ncbi:hypothetical protein BGZ54_000112 [Gamsiella multidivaricata]|nr:hypothetical protein BGZ54_000112 [Gamsiella multidivaricata]
MEKDMAANARSLKERRGIQRALGFKNIVIYVLIYTNLFLASKLFFDWSLEQNKSKNDGALSAFATKALKEGEGEGEGSDASTPEFWIKMALIVLLVLIGGIFAGLTIGLMGLDETNLQVLMASGSLKERAHAETVQKLLARGKHWVLVTLLLGNVIVNETLPVVLDSELGGGVFAILISTLLIVVFGEIIPQAVCARYGLAIGAYCAKPMLVLMYLMSPVAYPIAKLLDSWLGVHHGTTYRRTELKTLVSLHQIDGIGELTDDEVTIIASVLDLKEKSVSSVMTPLEDVFTLSEDAILDEHLMDEIVSAGYSRIPIYRHDDTSNFIGMLLVKRLITYDPADHIPVRQFTINSLPEAAPNTSCLDILNFFQEGRSHMAIVTSEPGGFGHPVGVITLEDVIEELLGEEIVDESDVYVDIHNKIKVIRKPSRNVNMIKNLKSLLRSPAIGESTPLLGNANGRKSTMPIDSKYMASGKTILQTRKSSSALIDTTTAHNTAVNASTTATSANKDITSEADVNKTNGTSKDNAASKDSEAPKNNGVLKHDEVPEEAAPPKDNGVPETTAAEHADGHAVNFKENAEVIPPREVTTPANETQSFTETQLAVKTPQEDMSLVIEIPEATGTYSINTPSEIIAAAIESAHLSKESAAAIEAAQLSEEPTAEETETSQPSNPISESASTSTLLAQSESSNTPGPSPSKKKKKKKKSNK